MQIPVIITAKLVTMVARFFTSAVVAAWLVRNSALRVWACSKPALSHSVNIYFQHYQRGYFLTCSRILGRVWGVGGFVEGGLSRPLFFDLSSFDLSSLDLSLDGPGFSSVLSDIFFLFAVWNKKQQQSTQPVQQDNLFLKTPAACSLSRVVGLVCANDLRSEQGR